MDNFQIETAQNINIHQNVAHITTRHWFLFNRPIDHHFLFHPFNFL